VYLIEPIGLQAKARRGWYFYCDLYRKHNKRVKEQALCWHAHNRTTHWRSGQEGVSIVCEEQREEVQYYCATVCCSHCIYMLMNMNGVFGILFLLLYILDQFALLKLCNVLVATRRRFIAFEGAQQHDILSLDILTIIVSFV
jgi:hypothetical protein